MQTDATRRERAAAAWIQRMSFASFIASLTPSPPAMRSVSIGPLSAPVAWSGTTRRPLFMRTAAGDGATSSVV